MDAANDHLIPDMGEDGHHTAELAGHLRRHIAEGAGDDLTDFFLEFLLHGLSLAFVLSPEYREEIRDYRATLQFRAGSGNKAGVDTVVRFDRGHMHVNPPGGLRPDTVVDFKNAKALRSFLLSKDQDVIASLLNDEVVVRGNLNHVNKFGALAASLLDRLP
jgi:hypothetical protein